MTRRGMAAALVFAAFASATGDGRAESAAPSQAYAHIVEVFAGAPEQPDADYVVLQVDAANLGQVSYGVIVLDHCGKPIGAFGSVSPQYLQGLSQGDRLLVARPQAESLFGVKADISAATDVPVENGWLERGSSEVIYGDYPGATAPALPLGKALWWDGQKWKLGDPTPTNSHGVTGSYDAGTSEMPGRATPARQTPARQTLLRATRPPATPR